MSESCKDVFEALLETHIYAEMSLEPDPTQSSDFANDVRRDWLDRWEKAQLTEPLPELFGVAEAAECLGIAIQNLSGKNKPTGLPDPGAELRATRVWRADNIRAFALEVGARRQARTSKEAV